METLLGKQYSAHNSLEDVKALRQLVEHSNEPNSLLFQHSFQSSYVFDTIDYNSKLAQRMSTLHNLIQSNILSQAMARKIAATGLEYKHLLYAHKRNPEEGISLLFRESDKISNKCRVTSSTKIIRKVINYLNTLNTDIK